MADGTTVHRQYLKAAVGALCLEKGYDSVTRLAIETLTEMIQSCKFVNSQRVLTIIKS